MKAIEQYHLLPPQQWHRNFGNQFQADIGRADRALLVITLFHPLQANDVLWVIRQPGHPPLERGYVTIPEVDAAHIRCCA